MKVIGITRRMDDLGRVVIPKEVRQSLGINEGDFLEIVGTDRGLLMQKCGEAYGNEPVPKGVETEEKDKIFVFRDQDCMVHLVSLSKKAEELCRWLEEQTRLMCVKLEMGGDMNTLTTMLEELRKEF